MVYIYLHLVCFFCGRCRVAIPYMDPMGLRNPGILCNSGIITVCMSQLNQISPYSHIPMILFACQLDCWENHPK